MSEKRTVKVRVHDGVLSIRIECKHGSIFAIRTMDSESEEVGIKYMADEIISSGAQMIDFIYEGDE